MLMLLIPSSWRDIIVTVQLRLVSPAPYFSKDLTPQCFSREPVPERKKNSYNFLAVGDLWISSVGNFWSTPSESVLKQKSSLYSAPSGILKSFLSVSVSSYPCRG